MVFVFGILSVFGIKYGFRKVKAFQIFVGKRIIDYWIESKFGKQYVYKIVGLQDGKLMLGRRCVWDGV